MSQMAVDKAVGVDPAFRLTHNVASGKKSLALIQASSDAFFADRNTSYFEHPPELIFLDGMHRFEYLLRDFMNSEAICADNSLIVMHDCLPFTDHMIHRSQEAANELSVGKPFHGYWTGDVWKIIPILRKHRPDLRLIFVDAAPTGLVFVTRLNPVSDHLKRNYLDIVGEFADIKNDLEALSELYENIDVTSTSEVFENHSQFLLS